jgi:hypothetical protein
MPLRWPFWHPTLQQFKHGNQTQAWLKVGERSGKGRMMRILQPRDRSYFTDVACFSFWFILKIGQSKGSLLGRARAPALLASTTRRPFGVSRYVCSIVLLLSLMRLCLVRLHVKVDPPLSLVITVLSRCCYDLHPCCYHRYALTPVTKGCCNNSEHVGRLRGSIWKHCCKKSANSA